MRLNRVVIPLLFLSLIPVSAFAGLVDRTACLVLGQANMISNQPNRGGAVAAGVLKSPSQLAVDTVTNRVFVADTFNNRVLCWRSMSSLINGKAADYVLGQANFTLNSDNRGGAPGAGTLSMPGAVAVDGANLWVADTGNHRILRYNTTTITNGASANLVLGQLDFTHNSANRGGSVTAATLSSPAGIAIDAGGNVWVADTGNNRVLKYAVGGLGNGAASSVVLGQADFTSYLANRNGSVDVNTLSGPRGMAFDAAGNLWVADSDNNRVLKYLSIALGTGADASLVLGQATFTANQPNRNSPVSAETLFSPYGVHADGRGDVWIADRGNSRILKYSARLLANGCAADYVLGQPDLSHGDINQGGTVSALTLAGPQDIVVDTLGNAWVADRDNHRVLEYYTLRISSVTPVSAYNSGSVRITNISGYDFVDGSTARLVMSGQPDIPAADLSVQSLNAITCTFDLAAKATGYWDIVITTGGAGALSASLSSAFNVKPMTVSAVAPASGYNSGPIDITSLSGAGFVPGSGVRLAKAGEPDIPATAVTYINAGLLTCAFDLAGKTTGVWDIVVSSGGPGSVTGVKSGAFTVKPVTVASVALNYGYNTGPTNNVVLLGAGFVTGSTVRLTKSGQEDIDGTDVRVLTSTAAVCRFNLTGQATGVWNVILSTGGPGSTPAVLANGFTIKPLSLTAVNPNNAFNTGPVTITSLTGNGFVAGTQVKLAMAGEDDIPAANVVVVSSSVISCRFNLWKCATGQWDVVASTGPRSAILSGGFAVKQMALTSVTPTLGYNTGSVSMSAVVGGGFVTGAAIRLKREGKPDISASNVVMINANKFMCDFDLTGAATGQWDVEVATDTLAVVLPGAFEVKPMSITSILPVSGYNSAQLSISKIAGLGFVTGAGVRLVKAGEDDVIASNVTVTGGNTISCTVDLAGKATGAWDVMVTTGGGAGWLSAVKAGAFTVNPMTVNTITPDYGCNTGLVSISALQGAGFVPGTAVKLTRSGEPDIEAVNITVTGGSTIACKFNLTGAATGLWDLVVSTGGPGSVTVSKPGLFTVRPLRLFSVTPNSAANTGTVSITSLAGEGFVAGSRVSLVKAGEADIIATNVMVPSSSSINCKFNLSGAATGAWDIVLSTGGPGSLTAVLPACFSVRPLLSTSITPASGYNTGPVNITRLTGDGFISGMVIKLVRTGEADIVATNAVVSNPTLATCRFNLTGAATGLWSVEVETGTVADILPDAFEVLPMTLDSISPDSGYDSGPVNVTLRGGGFVAGSVIKLTKDGESPITGTGVTVSSASITGRFDLREKATGYWSVAVSTGGEGSLSTALPASFRISSMTVNSLIPGGGCNTAVLAGIRINGDGFVNGSKVKLVRSGESDINATAVTVSNSRLITCTADLRGRAIGYWDVVVSSSSLIAVLPSGFNVKPMLVSAVNPPSGCNTGKITVTDILGDGFLDGSGVKLMKTGQPDIPGTGITVYSSSRIVCTFDLTARATGYWDLVVTSGSYNASLAGGFLVEPMDVYSVNPSTGYNTGFLMVNPVAGRGFVPGSTVRLAKSGAADIPASNVMVVSSSVISCRFDLRNVATGYWDLVVSTGGAGSLTAARPGAVLVKPMGVIGALPTIASNTGPVPIEVTGEGFVSGSSLKLVRSGEPDIAATGVAIPNSGKITGVVDLSGAATGWWNILVATGALSAVQDSGFFVNAIVKVDSITPDWGYNTGMLDITDLAGQSFVQGSAIKLTKTGCMDITADDVTVVNSEHITCRLNLIGKATGYWNVMLICGSSSVNLFNGLYVRPMAVASLTPASQYNTGRVDTASIRGEGFVEGVTARLTRTGQPDIPADNLVLVSPEEIACSFDTLGGATGYWTLVVSTGSVDAVYPDAFCITPMRVTGVMPAQASNTGVFDIAAITGEGFVPACGVRLTKTGQPDITATAVNVVDPNTISCRLNLSGVATGLWNIAVSSGGAGAVEAVLPDSFTIKPMVIDTVTPPYGCNTGTAAVTLDGSDFLPGSTVRLTRQGESDMPAASVVYVDSTRLICGFDLTGAPTGFWNVAVASGVLTVTLPDGFEIRPISIASISPAYGYNTGTAVIDSLNGDGFVQGTTVKLSRSGEPDIPASPMTILSSSRIACVFDIRNATPGYWDVVAATGPRSALLLRGFHVRALTVSSVNPPDACNTGTAVREINGGGFIAGTTVRMTRAGETAIDGTQVSVLSSTAIICSFPLLGAPTGAWNIVATTGSLSGTLYGGFPVKPLQVKAITPAVGYNSGTLSDAVLTGEGFSTGITARLCRTGEADIPATGIVVVDSGTLTCTFNVVGAAGGAWSVVVETGPVAARLEGGLLIRPMQVASATPATVYNAGRSDICVNGGGFQPGSQVTFTRAGEPDIVPETVSVLSSTAIACRADLTLRTTGSWDAVVKVNGFTAALPGALQIKPMSISAVAPASQFNSMQSAVFAVTGEGLVSGTTAAFIRSGESSRAMTAITVTSSTGAVCLVDLSGAATGYWDLVFTSGPVSAAKINALLVLPMNIVSVLPTSGINTGGVSAEIAGNGFVVGATVRLERSGQPDIAGSPAAVIDGSRITASFNLVSAATGYWDLVVETGTVRAVLPSGFLVEPMSVSSVFPAAGYATDGERAVTVTGAGFVSGAAVLLRRAGLADIPAGGVNCTGPGTLTCSFDLRGKTTGYWTLVVASGTVTAQLADGFLVQPMKLTAISPDSGSNTSTRIDVSHLAGEGFSPGTIVALRKAGFSDIQASDIDVVSGEKITCKFNLDGKATGYWDVVVTTAPVSAVLPSGFLITPMEIISLAPTCGYVTGAANSLTVYGAGFTPTTGIKLTRAGEADVPASSVTMENESTLHCSFPLRGKTTGYWNMVANDGIVTVRLDNGYEIRPLSIDSITPSGGNNNGPVNITNLAGAGFVGGCTVKLTRTGASDVTASMVAVTGHQQIACMLDLENLATGYWNLEVSTGAYAAVLPDAFEVKPAMSAREAIDHSRDAVLIIKPASGEIRVDIPAQTFAQDVTMTVSTAAVGAPPHEQPIVLTGIGLEMYNNLRIQPSGNMMVTVSYRPQDIAGLDETKLALGRFDENHQQWVALPSRIYAADRKVAGYANHLSRFALIQVLPSNNLESINVYPNPFNPTLPLHAQGLTIDRLTAAATIQIFTVNGELVRDIEYASQDGRAVWDGKNNAGRLVARGVYIVMIRSASGMKKVKIAVEK